MKILMWTLTICAFAGVIVATALTILGNIPVGGIAWAATAVCAFAACDAAIALKNEAEGKDKSKETD